MVLDDCIWGFFWLHGYGKDFIVNRQDALFITRLVTYNQINLLRVINTGAADGAYNMALDEALLESVKKGGWATLRFYTFSSPAITIGYLQPIQDIDIKRCAVLGIDILRRLTGGRAVVHDGDLTYSLTIPVGHPIFGGTSLETYKKVSLAFSIGLKNLGVRARFVKTSNKFSGKNPSCFSSASRYELQVRGRKILGSAQRREKGFILQQGTIPINPHRVVNFFDNRESTTLSEILEQSIRVEEIVDALLCGIKVMGTKIVVGELTSKEEKYADEVRNKYLSKDWIFSKKTLDKSKFFEYI